MLRSTPDGFGGFFVFDDPLLDFQGDIVIILIAAFFIVAPLTAIVCAPELFLPAVACLLWGVFFRIFFSGTASFYFLAPFTLPLFSYTLFASAHALMTFSYGENPGSLMNPLLMIPVTGAFLLLTGVVLYGSLFGEDYDGLIALFTIVVGALAFFPAVLQTDENGIVFFSMRVITLIAIVWSIVNFVGWCIQNQKGNINWTQMLYNLKLAGIGVLPLVVLLILKPITTSRVGGLIVALITLIFYGVLAVLTPKMPEMQNKYSNQKVRHSGNIMLAAPLFFVIALFFSGLMRPVLSAEMLDIVSILGKTPLQPMIETICMSIANSFGALYETLFYGLTSLLAAIFNHSGFHIQISSVFSILLTLVLSILFMSICCSIVSKFKKRIK